MSHNITWEESGVYREFYDFVTGEEILASNFELQAHPKFETIDYVINDFTKVNDHSITIPHTSAYAKTDEISAQEKTVLKIGLIVTKKDLFDLADSYQNMMETMKFECKIFKTIGQTRNWVNAQ